VFLIDVTFLAMEQHVNVKLGKTRIETHEMLQTAYGDEALSRSTVFDCSNNLKPRVGIFRMMQGVGVLQLLEMQTQLEMSVKC
jgi:hypothetical protein